MRSEGGHPLEATEDQIEKLAAKLAQLCREYEQYFLGLRPREPTPLRGEVRAMIARLSERKLVNTAVKFRLGTLSSRYQAMLRRWEETLRRIDAGCYERHQFRAALHVQAGPGHTRNPAVSESANTLFRHYRDARLACGQSTRGLSSNHLSRSLEAERRKLRERFGADSEFQFRVAILDGHPSSRRAGSRAEAQPLPPTGSARRAA